MAELRWVPPAECEPPHRITHPEKFTELRAAFERNGWDESKPALIGYSMNGRIQLVSGSHRSAAALGVLNRIPVWYMEPEELEDIWGTPDWIWLIQNPPIAGEDPTDFPELDIQIVV